MGRSLTRPPVAALDDLGGGPRPRSPDSFDTEVLGL